MSLSSFKFIPPSPNVTARVRASSRSPVPLPPLEPNPAVDPDKIRQFLLKRNKLLGKHNSPAPPTSPNLVKLPIFSELMHKKFNNNRTTNRSAYTTINRPVNANRNRSAYVTINRPVNLQKQQLNTVKTIKNAVLYSVIKNVSRNAHKNALKHVYILKGKKFEAHVVDEIKFIFKIFKLNDFIKYIDLLISQINKLKKVILSELSYVDIERNYISTSKNSANSNEMNVYTKYIHYKDADIRFKLIRMKQDLIFLHNSKNIPFKLIKDFTSTNLTKNTAQFLKTSNNVDYTFPNDLDLDVNEIQYKKYVFETKKHLNKYHAEFAEINQRIRTTYDLL
jgi:hypothetical protein